MIKILIPNSNIQERKYIINVIFNDFLGLSYKINIGKSDDYEIVLSNNNKLIIEDSFFSLHNSDLSYLTLKNIPKDILFTENKFTTENNIPVIYGSSKLKISGNKIICGIDIFASSFFMLTRWEEYANKKRDEHNRFSAFNSLSYKHNFLHRPIINEYVEMFWNMLEYLSCKEKRKERNFKINFTHDIDYLLKGKLRWTYNILKSFNFRLLFKNIKSVFYNKDPFDNFAFFMDISEKNNTKSHFYFMADKNGFATRYYIDNKHFSSIINNIKQRKHIIGFHPGYKTYNNSEIWNKEKKLIEKKTNCKVTKGRQHFLRCDITKTLNIWSSANMQYDSTLGYSKKEGYRCGTGDEFYVFDFINQKQLKIKEQPLIIMDETLYSKNTITESEKIIKNYINISKKYKMSLTILFHNSMMTEEIKTSYLELFT